MSVFPHLGPSGLTTNLPMAPCLALLRQFDPDNPTPAQAVTAAAEVVSDTLGEAAMAEVNDGEFAAMIDMAVAGDLDEPLGVSIVNWIKGGNHKKPADALRYGGPRNQARRQVWLIGNSA